MKEGVLMSVVRSNPDVQNAIRQALDKRKDSRTSTAALDGGGSGTGNASAQGLKYRAGTTSNNATRRQDDGADVVDLLDSDEQFI